MSDIYDYQVGKDKTWLKQHPGRQTGSITIPIELPVKWLVTLDGLRGEDEKLKFSMPKIKGMAESCILSKKWRDDNPMLLEVHHNQEVYIFDGNHRARAAKLVKLDTYPCKIKFYGGSEDTFSVQKILKKYASEESVMTDQEKHITAMQTLVNKAKIAIEHGLDYRPVLAEMQQFASESGGNVGGDTDTFSNPTDQEYQNERDSGENLAGENDPNKGDQRRTGPREPNPMVQEANNMQNNMQKPHPICDGCKHRTDECICMETQQPPSPGKLGPRKTKPSTPKQFNVGTPGDPTKHRAAADPLDMITGLIKDSSRMTREASHMEEIEIPFSALPLLENGIDYHMSGAQQQVSMLVDNYLRTKVYTGNRRYTIARIEQEKNKFFVKILVFDRQIEHEGSAPIDTKDGRLSKVSNIKSNKMVKTAWKMRLTEIIGENDDTGLVRCPLEGASLTRSCGICPFAGNPRSYIMDGGVECHADEGFTYLNGLGVKEHRPLDNSSNG